MFPLDRSRATSRSTRLEPSPRPHDELCCPSYVECAHNRENHVLDGIEIEHSRSVGRVGQRMVNDQGGEHAHARPTEGTDPRPTGFTIRRINMGALNVGAYKSDLLARPPRSNS